MFFLFSASAWTQNAVLRAVLCSFLILPGAAYGGDLALTLAYSQQLAIERSQLLQAKDHAASSAREMSVAAGRLPDPVLQVGVENLSLEGAERFSLARESMTMRRIGVMQEMTHPDKRRLRSERFLREAEKADAEKSLAIAAVGRDTAIAWLDRYYAEASRKLIAEQVAQARLEIEAAEAAYRGGRGSQSDIFNARSALVAIEDRASQSERILANARVMLARWIGDEAGRPLAGKPQLEAVSLDPAGVERALARHPEIAVLARQEALAETDASLARANRKADWSIEVAYLKRGSAFSDMVSVGVSVPLQWNRKNRQDRELAASVASAGQARAEREEALRALVAEIRTMFNEWQNGRERQARYERELLPLAASGTAAVTAAYRGGRASLPEVLRSRGAELDARLEVLQLEASTARLWAQLNFLFPQNAPLTASGAYQITDSK